MKVLIASDVYHSQVNGVVTSIDILVRELESYGHEVRILTLSSNRSSYIEDNVYYNGSISAGFYPDMRMFPKLNNNIKKEILEWGPDLIHTQSEFSAFLFADYISKKLDIPIVHTYHTLYQYYLGYVLPGKKLGDFAVRKYFHRVLNKTSCVIAPTEKVRECLDEYKIDTQIQVVPTGIVGNLPDKISEERKKELKLKYHLSLDKKIVLTVGRLAKEKNIQELIFYMEELLVAEKELQFLIVGGGPYYKELEMLVQKNNMEKSVIFTGMLPHEDLDEIYQLGDLFVSASISETQGLTVLEAMTNGLPLLCREDKSLSNTLLPEKNGLFYHDKVSFLESLRRILKDKNLQTAYSEQSRITALEYSMTAFAGKIEDIYRETLENQVKYKNMKEDYLDVETGKLSFSQIYTFHKVS